jgi:TonB family protein
MWYEIGLAIDQETDMAIFQGTMRGMRRIALLCAAAFFFCGSPLSAQEPPCKVKNGPLRVNYPDMARRMKIEGTVRLSLQLGPGGVVRESKVLGGNPLLVSAAQESVKSARFENADGCVLTFEFKN